MGGVYTFGRKSDRAQGRSGGQPPPRPARRQRIRLSDFGGLFALAIMMGLAAGYYFIPSAQRLASPIGLAAARQSGIERSFAICGFGSRINCVIDGDTFYAGGEKIRIADINTPELSNPQCGREASLARQAQKRLHSLLNAGPIELRRTTMRDRDVYGRKLRSVYREGRSLGRILVTEGLAHPWRGYKESWCG